MREIYVSYVFSDVKSKIVYDFTICYPELKIMKADMTTLISNMFKKNMTRKFSWKFMQFSIKRGRIDVMQDKSK